jgi:hypothetical protein
MTGEAAHGTYACYQTEKRNGKVPCDACLAAFRDYMRAWRKRTGKNQGRTGCVPGLGWPHADPEFPAVRP